MGLGWNQQKRFIRKSWVSSGNFTLNLVLNKEYKEVISLLPRLVTDEININLLADVTDEEIRKATLDLGGIKASDPNGFSGIFYQHHWDLVGHSVQFSISSSAKNVS